MPPVRIAKGHMNCLGIDIGGTSVKLAILRDSQVVCTSQSSSYSRADTPQLIAAIREAAAGAPAQIDSAGVCVPCIYDAQKECVNLSVNVPGLTGIRLPELLSEAIARPVVQLTVASDAVATGYDIFVTRKLTGRLLVLAMGTGIGAAVLDDGRPLWVDGHTPGHVGQLDVSLDDSAPVGPDGGAGSLEAYTGAPAIAMKYGGDVPAAVASWHGDEPPLRALARAIRICHAMYRPHHVCLAGGIGIHLGHVLARLRALIETSLTNIARSGWTLTLADSEMHAACGAARLAARDAATRLSSRD